MNAVPPATAERSISSTNAPAGTPVIVKPPALGVASYDRKCPGESSKYAVT